MAAAQGIADVLGENTMEETGTPFDGQLPAVGANYEQFSFSSKRVMLERLAARAGSVVPRGDFSPVLKNFLVQVSTGYLQLTATDLELTVISHTTAVVTSLLAGAPNRAVLPAKKLLAILGEAPEGDVTITVAKDKATVTAGSASWVLFLSSDGSDYPVVPDTSKVAFSEVPRAPLAAALKTVRYAVSKTKQDLQQVAIAKATDGTMCATACDKTRFSRVRLPAGFPAMRIPTISKAVDELVKLLEDSEAETVSVADAGTKLVFRIGSTVLMASKLGLDYPDVEKLLLQPALENAMELVVDRSELTDALRRVRINADPDTAALGMELSNGQVTLVSQDKFHNTAQQTIPATWGSGTLKLVVNHQFLSEMLAAHPAPSCTFRLGKPVGKRRPALLLMDPVSGTTGIINQMSVSALVGY